MLFTLYKFGHHWFCTRHSTAIILFQQEVQQVVRAHMQQDKQWCQNFSFQRTEAFQIALWLMIQQTLISTIRTVIKLIFERKKLGPQEDILFRLYSAKVNRAPQMQVLLFIRLLKDRTSCLTKCNQVNNEVSKHSFKCI